MATSKTTSKSTSKNKSGDVKALSNQLKGISSVAKSLGINTAKSDAMVKQTERQGSKSFAGSSYDKGQVDSVSKINSTVLNQSTPYVSAEQPKVTDPGDLVGAGNAGVVTGMSDMTLTDEGLFEKINNGTLTPSDTLKYIQDNTPKPPSHEKEFFKSDEYDAVQREQKAVNDYTAQINTIQKRAMAQQLALEGQGRGQTESFVGGEQARINREAAIAALPIQAQLAAAQGNLEFAQKQLETVFTLRMQDAQNKYKYETDKLNSIVGFLDKTETRQYNERMTIAGREYQKTQDNINYIRQLVAQAREYGNTSVMGQLGALDPASPTFDADVARISKGIVKPVSPVRRDTQVVDGKLIDMQTGEIISTISGVKDKPQTEGQAKAQTFADRMNGAEQILSNSDKFGSFFARGGVLPNFLKTEDRQKFEQAQRDFINSVLRRESGAVISEEEFENARQQYFPQPGDGQGVLDQKRMNRNTVINGFYREANVNRPVSPGDIIESAGVRYKVAEDGVTLIEI